MNIFGFEIKPFVLIATFVGVVGLGFGLVQFQSRNIENRTITQQGLSAARDLKGTFEGVISTVTTDTGSPGVCRYNSQMRMVIENLNNTQISGTIAYNFQSMSGPCTGPSSGWSDPQAFTANIAGSKITRLDLGPTNGVFTGSLTTDTITLIQSITGKYDGQSYTVTYTTSPIHLLRQH